MARGPGRPRKIKLPEIKVVPPTKKQTQDLLFQLRQGTFLEHAALLAGISLRMLERWIELGRQCVPGYVEFTDVIDRSNAELGDKLSRAIMQMVEDGDPGAIKWLYERRLGAAEKRSQERWLDVQDKSFEVSAETEEVVSLEDAEKMLEASLLASEDGGLN